MSRQSHLGPRPFAGGFTPYSKALANFGMCSVVAAGSRYAFATCHPLDDRPCCIIPIVESGRVLVSTFFAVRRAFTPRVLANGDTAVIVADWARYCRAFTVAELDPSVSPRLRLLDCNSTRLAQSELMQAACSDVPSLEAIDNALGTSLELVERPAERLLLEGLAPCV